MLYINSFAVQDIKPIAAYKLYGQADIQPRIQKIFEGSGVFTPTNWDELRHYFCSDRLRCSKAEEEVKEK